MANNRKKAVYSFLILLLLIFFGAGYHQYASSRPVVLKIALYSGNSWGVPQNFAYAIYDKAAEIFSRQPGNEKIRIEYTTGTLYKYYSEWFAQLVLKGKEPDLFLLVEEDFNTYASIGLLEDLGPHIDRSQTFDRTAIYPEALRAGTFRGRQYSLPISVVPSFMIYNKSLLDREGIAIDQESWDWRQFYSICDALTKDTDGDGELDQFGVYGYDWHHAFYTNDDSLFNENGTKIGYHPIRMQETLDFLSRLYQLKQDKNLSERDFEHGAVGFKPFNLSEYRAYGTYPYRILKYEDFEWEAIAYPKGPYGRSASKLYTVQIGMSSRSRNKEAAFRFMEFIAGNEEIQHEVWKGTNTLPANQKVVQSVYRTTGIHSEGMKLLNPNFLSRIIRNSYTDPDFKLYSYLDDIISQNIFQIVAQGIPSKTGEAALRADINQTIEAMRR